ncbi:LipA and NB-ARC domain-containing protein [Nannizzia gypsea CBS 118893]|uniref:LipA and NB-ARC domain-containing protein n=1 Tax=Arthroderma gypseum (strain ATCC MYA-4604 / CBS 118893) TaxID=535722 RepID=E4V705_ARTGP|nr:LipA and NB-ARC domain-containing protein [Nannizzia gypsea CBS 118893]EFQ96871.1 LipA and NB-ARC domain-containing protein [Nannizzia gypsea CBS 118893]
MAAESEKHPSWGVSILHEPKDAVFDVVAVHGLNGHAFNTWTHKKTGIMWLKDLLPKELPNARIMTYGYRARFADFTAHQDIRTIAENLLQQLSGLRQDNALSQRSTEKCNEVKDATYGILFLATPHSGSSLARSGRTISNLIPRMFSFSAGRELVTYLHEGSEVLSDITLDFMHQVSKYKIVSCYETRPIKIMGIPILVVTKDSSLLKIPGEEIFGMDAHHRDICRFSAADDPFYQAIVPFFIGFSKGIDKLLIPPTPASSSVTIETDTLFDVPYARCVEFQGRKQLLADIELYFGEPHSDQQRVYGISGLGGAGKTQTALHYAFKNRFKYKSGVVFFNATSNTTLIADFHRIHDLLHRGKASNKIDYLKRWFSKPTRRDWLLIFDGFSDLNSVQIRDFFPNTSWGHIIVTSRDQSTIGLVSPCGTIITPLEEEAAVKLLLGKAAILNPTRIGVHEKTVSTVWELNFRQLENDAPGASLLLLLFSFLEAAQIPETMLQRACSDMQIWSENGGVRDISAERAGIDSEIISMVNNELRFDQAIEQLLAFSLIQTSITASGRSFSVHPLVQSCASHRVSIETRQKWQVQAIILVTHVFRKQRLSSGIADLGDTGNQMFPHIPRVLKEFETLDKTCPLYPKAKRAMCLLLLEGSKFNGNVWRQDTIAKAKDLLEGRDPVLEARVARRESTILRLHGKIGDSYRVIEKCLYHGAFSDGLDISKKANAEKGKLIISYAGSLIMENQLERAKKELESWQPKDPNHPSLMESSVLSDRNVSLGRLLKNQGFFSEALPYFERIFHDIRSEQCNGNPIWQMNALANLTDLYLEVRRPDDAEATLRETMKIMYSRGWQRYSIIRRLQLSLAESFIMRAMFQTAEECLIRLIPILEGIEDPNMNQKTEHFRAWSGLARVSHLQGHWEQAITRWKTTIKVVEKSGWSKKFSHGVMLQSLAHAQFQADEVTESRTTLQLAMQSLAAEKRKYWIVGLGSYWFDYIQAPLGQIGQSKVIIEPDAYSEKEEQSRERLIADLFGS